MICSLKEFGKNCTIKEIEVITKKRTLFQRIVGLFPTVSIERDYKNAIEQIIPPDFVYMWRTVADKAYVRFFCDIKKKYPKCKIIVEIFTYPYNRDIFLKWDAWSFYIYEVGNGRVFQRDKQEVIE